MNIMKGFMDLLVKSGPGKLNRQGEPKIERESKKRSRRRLIQESENGECICACYKSIWKSVAY